MKRELSISLVAAALSIAVGLAAIRIFEPRLFGIPKDLQVVKLDSKLPAFFDGAVRSSDLRASDFQLHDPITVVRGKPFLPEIEGVGPHDLLGFRNRSVPQSAQVVVIGDSQTYGNNALADETWPAAAAAALPSGVHVYSMAVGGWSPLQYLHLAQKALGFAPQALVVAVYTGNDAAEAFRTAYAVDYWRDFRIDSKLDVASLPTYALPIPESDLWKKQLHEIGEVTFTPKARLVSNNRGSAAVRAGYEISLRALRDIARLARQQGVKPVLVVIPTKELVMEPLVLAAGPPFDAHYVKLLEDERKNISYLVSGVSGEMTTLDLTSVLQSAVQKDPALYPWDSNGHPTARGYAVIGAAVAAAVRDMLVIPQPGVYEVKIEGKDSWFYVLADGELVQYASTSSARSRGVDVSAATPVDFNVLRQFPVRTRYE